ncbi:hypothetical protein D9613_010051 [Agrocybe pediades]|uniref:Large ribosomal subunit protein mL59 domain-containing protein n=1 Tax=Agrocybe pediades TaxID=84607 RepID=A0A8H4QXJ2_9AGAR|nr:hypothetical protein D9613_010051 [Agrocybe pediades]KAF9567135.1 hypothetical protein CPC08DRAFT_703375 [Agrocybe pediades]
MATATPLKRATATVIKRLQDIEPAKLTTGIRVRIANTKAATASPLKIAAATVIQRLQDREIAGLSTHLRQFGPLPDAAVAAAKSASGTAVVLPNPFLPKKNPKNNKWRAPKYSLRRQADIVKLAQAAGLLDAVPPCQKKLAAELRMERVKASLSPNDAKTLERHEKRVQFVPNRELSESVKGTVASMMKRGIELTTERLDRVNRELELIENEENASLSKEFLRGEKDEGALERTERKEAFLKEKQEYQKTIADHNARIAELEAEAEAEKTEKKEKAAAEKELTVIWAGELKERKVPGSELGTRLYTGKKRMFKGHLWERKRARRIRRHTILMRDMAKRIERYKSYYKKRKPNPLKPSRYTKPPKLPY